MIFLSIIFLITTSRTTMKKIDSISLDEYGIEVIERGNSMDAKKKVLLNNENTYLLSCKDFSGKLNYSIIYLLGLMRIILEINILLSGKSEQSQMNLKTHQSRFAASIAQIPFRYEDSCVGSFLSYS